MVNSPETQPDSHSVTPIVAANNGMTGSHRTNKSASAPHTQQTNSTAERRTREAENAGWLEKNIHALLAIAIMCITFAMFVFVINASMDSTFKGSDAKDIVIYILGALTTVATQVVSYYFGSSSSSVDKGKTLSAIAKRG